MQALKMFLLLLLLLLLLHATVAVVADLYKLMQDTDGRRMDGTRRLFHKLMIYNIKLRPYGKTLFLLDTIIILYYSRHSIS